MTNLCEKAHLLDAEDNPVVAADACEQCIAAGVATLDDYVNLAVLYFVCNDGGDAAHHQLDVAFLERAWTRMDDVLQDAEDRFGPHPEITFWRRYCPWILGMADTRPNVAERVGLLTSGETLVPAFYLVGASAEVGSDDAIRHRALAARLLIGVTPGVTARQRCIRSVTESTLRNVTRPQSDGPSR